ncbi:ATP-binding protein [Fulvivirga sediminis]|uniref:ATP-binding protein n=1 Tax=Fulvivirga sediminis TaxID=2803949 RepID=A0A937F8C0_9BACT|nr:ATP-binding protein [Fulvivirga sediminis]MBL3655848.1 ATP-binding protein [Fulvivirga sediminis]
MLQESLFDSTKNTTGGNFGETIELFNNQIGEITNELKHDFQNVSGIESNLSFPTEIADLFQRLIIDTKSGEHDIPLKLRGDGIRLRYIPTIMNHIASTSKYFELWGFDEPENSCEYGLAKKLAENFSTNYLNHAQVFIASHSFNFISLEGDKISKYRVYKEEGGHNSKILQITKANEKHIQEDIGLLVINEQLADLYSKLEAELEIAEQTKNQLNEIQKPYLIFEGKTDNILFSLAYQALKGNEFEDNYFLNKHEESNDGGSVGSGAPFIGEFLRNHINKMPTENLLIGVFDYDNEGFNQLKNLKSQYEKVNIDGFNEYVAYKHKAHTNFYAISLVTPAFRSNFTHAIHPQHCHLSTELLLQDTDIPTANRAYPTLFDNTVFGFTGKKKNFAEKISEKVDNGEDIDFSGFKPTIDLIEKIREITGANRVDGS